VPYAYLVWGINGQPPWLLLLLLLLLLLGLRRHGPRTCIGLFARVKALVLR